jgi:HAD superfamily hydrolase (TIGR01484 family)
MKPLSSWPLNARQNIVGVFTDIDDTLTSKGAITPDALQALGHLKASGLMVIPITGRPVGWSLPFASSWPIDALVAENGAVALLPDGSRRYQQDATTRQQNFARMQSIAAQVVQQVPGCVMAQDSPGRETDIAFDHSEFHHLSSAQIDAALGILKSQGMTATVSSIHITAWFGNHNKWEGARWIFKELTGRDLSQELDRWVYVGDSTNDQVMFEHFSHSVGVANIRRFEKDLVHLPEYVALGDRGAGFAEMAALILPIPN